MVDIAEMYHASPPQTQEEVCALACRVAIKRHGVVDEELVPAAANGLAAGLFGPAFESADHAQRALWIDMMEREYRKVVERTQQNE